MLVSLHVRNFVLLEDCRIEFHPGLNVLTGETGAGKSILVGALNLLIGERGSTESVRDSTQDAVVEAAFDLASSSPQAQLVRPLLEESGILWEEGDLILSRILSPNGRNRIFINNTQCLLKILKDVGTLLIDLHGQHDHQSLLHKSSYRPLLDRFGNYNDLLMAYREIYENWQSILGEIRQLEDDDRERLRREDSLRFQLQEILEAELREGEDEEILARLQVIQHAEKLHEGCHEILHVLDEGDERGTAVLDKLDRLEIVLSHLERLDGSLKSVLETWQSLLISLHEVTRELEGYQNSLEFDPGDLNRLQERHFLIKNLKNKYGATLTDILRYGEQCRDELNRIEHVEEERDRLHQQELQWREQLIHFARQLHAQRIKIAQKIARQVGDELRSLGMESARFEIQVEYHFSSPGIDLGEVKPVALGPEGADFVEFMISTIPDKPLRPLKEIASGGEISRIMLAIKCVFGKADAVPLMVFDEIDVGVGGRTANVVGERLAALSKEKQVLCITHLPQIAARAARNLRVDKRERDGRLSSTVSVLSEEQRVEEVARMLGGDDVTASRRYAKELLKNSKKKPSNINEPAVE